MGSCKYVCLFNHYHIYFEPQDTFLYIEKCIENANIIWFNWIGVATILGSCCFWRCYFGFCFVQEQQLFNQQKDYKLSRQLTSSWIYRLRTLNKNILKVNLITIPIENTPLISSCLKWKRLKTVNRYIFIPAIEWATCLHVHMATVVIHTIYHYKK